MSTRALSAILALLVMATGCDKKSGKSEADHQEYGAGIKDPGDLTTIRAILDNPKEHDGKSVTVKGIIASVCPSSGCFLRLGEGASQIYVDLKESGFTVPPGKNIGHLAYVSGLVRAGGDEIRIDGTGVRILEK